MRTVSIQQDKVSDDITHHPNRDIAANNSQKQEKSAFLDYKWQILHKQTMLNNRERSPDCGDIGFKSKSSEMSLKQPKYNKKLRNYKSWWWFRFKMQKGHVIILCAR